MKILLSIFVLFSFNSFGQQMKMSIPSDSMRVEVNRRMELVQIRLGPQMNTDRPSYSMSAQTVRKGVFQIEAGLQLNIREQNNPTTNFLQAPAAVFRIGLSDRVELRFQNGLNLRRGFGNIKASMENFELGMKFNLVQTRKSNLSMLVQGIAPTASGEWQAREKGGRLVFAVDKKIKKFGQLGYNIGGKFSWIEDNEVSFDIQHSFFYVHTMNSKLSIFGEIHSLVPELNDMDIDLVELNMDFGLTYEVKSNIQLDYSFGFGLLNRMNFHSVGISYRIAPDPESRRQYGN